MKMAGSSLTWVEISQKALIHNLQQFRKRIKKEAKIMVVVKANAYGHGMVETAQILDQAKAAWFGVNNLEEGLLLREKKIKQPILVLGFILPGEIRKAIESDLSFVAYQQNLIRQANKESKKIKKKARIHLKIETGTNRQGISLAQLPSFLKFIQKQPEIVIEGLCTHFANIEDTLEPYFAMKQLDVFKKALQLTKKINLEVPFKHTACSAAAILYPKTFFNLVRVGIGLYGLWPSRETELSAKEKKINFNLKPVLTWKTKVIQIKSVAKGETVGYGRTFKTKRKTKIAVLPVGYWDGYDRKLSNQGQVLIKGQSASVVGRVCMNMMMADVTDIPWIKIGETVILLGRQGKKQITAEEIAQKIGTINYEMVTRINPLLPREVV